MQLEVFSGQPAGDADAVGNFAPDSVNFKVRRKLGDLFQLRANTTLVPIERPQRNHRNKRGDEEEKEE